MCRISCNLEGWFLFGFVFQKLGASIEIRVWIELKNPMRGEKEQDSSDLMGIEKEDPKLAFKNLNLGNWEDDSWQK